MSSSLFKKFQAFELHFQQIHRIKKLFTFEELKNSTKKIFQMHTYIIQHSLFEKSEFLLNFNNLVIPSVSTDPSNYNSIKPWVVMGCVLVVASCSWLCKGLLLVIL